MISRWNIIKSNMNEWYKFIWITHAKTNRNRVWKTTIFDDFLPLPAGAGKLPANRRQIAGGCRRRVILHELFLWFRKIKNTGQCDSLPVGVIFCDFGRDTGLWFLRITDENPYVFQTIPVSRGGVWFGVILKWFSVIFCDFL